MSEFGTDILDQVFILLDVKDLIIFKSVCKSWKSLITSPQFIKSYLNHNIITHKTNFHEILYKRLVIAKTGCVFDFRSKVHDDTIDFKSCRLVGTYNGLVCIISPSDAQVLVANPSTREVRNLTTPQVPKNRCLCWGFGYDSLLDDYKVVLSFRRSENVTVFQVLTLKTNEWRTVGEVKYVSVIDTNVGTLCDGALHWFMLNQKHKNVIMCFDLCKEEFKEIPQPDDDAGYCSSDDKWFLGTFVLGMNAESLRKPSWLKFDEIQNEAQSTLGSEKIECLCILCWHGDVFEGWVMNKYKEKLSWEFMSHEYFIECGLGAFCYKPMPFPMTSKDVRGSIFVQSFASPYPQGTLKRKRQTMISRRTDKPSSGPSTTYHLDQESLLDNYSTKIMSRPPFIQDYYSKWMKRSGPKLAISHDIPPETFSSNTSLSINITPMEVMALLTKQELEMTILALFVLGLHNTVDTELDLSGCVFLNPFEVNSLMCQKQPTRVGNYLREVFSQPNKHNYLLPYHQGRHWSFFILRPNDLTGYILDSKCIEKTKDHYRLSSLVESIFSGFRWNFPKVQQQESNWECGYYVMRWIYDFVKFQQYAFPSIIPWNNTRPYEHSELDDMVRFWTNAFPVPNED